MYNLLIVDDEHQIRNLIRLFVMRNPNVQVIAEAANGVEGFEKSCRFKPEIVITDIRMPDMDGLTLIEKLATALPHTRVLIVSGYDDFQYAQRAMRYGAAGYLLKPLDENELHEVLNKTICELDERQAETVRYAQAKAVLTKLQDSIAATNETETDLYCSSPVIQKVISYIHANYNRDLSLSEIAALMYMNAAYLSRLFKEKTGMGFLEMTTQVRMAHARDILARPEFRIHEIAEMLGYRSASHFIGVFKDHFGVTPNEYREVQDVEKGEQK